MTVADTDDGKLFWDKLGSLLLSYSTQTLLQVCHIRMAVNNGLLAAFIAISYSATQSQSIGKSRHYNEVQEHWLLVKLTISHALLMTMVYHRVKTITT